MLSCNTIVTAETTLYTFIHSNLWFLTTKFGEKKLTYRSVSSCNNPSWRRALFSPSCTSSAMILPYTKNTKHHFYKFKFNFHVMCPQLYKTNLLWIMFFMVSKQENKQRNVWLVSTPWIKHDDTDTSASNARQCSTNRFILHKQCARFF